MKTNEPLPSKKSYLRFSAPIMRTIYKYIYKERGNCVMGVVGMPNRGKSYLAVKTALIWQNWKADLNELLVYNVQDLIDKTFSFIYIDGRPLSLKRLEKIDNVENFIRDHIDSIEIVPNQVVIFDEAGTSVYVREFFSMDNKTMGKLLQVWRFIRMLIIIVVPSDLKIAEKTICRFLNIEVSMRSLKQGDHAKAVVYEYIDWDQKKQVPIKRRCMGCRWGGFIKVSPLPKKWADKYERIATVHKVKVLMTMGKEYVNKVEDAVGRSRSIWDDVNYCLEHPARFRNQKGKWDSGLVQAYLQVGINKSQQIKKLLDRKSAPVHAARPPELSVQGP